MAERESTKAELQLMTDKLSLAEREVAAAENHKLNLKMEAHVLQQVIRP
jgi:hypothetical protein